MELIRVDQRNTEQVSRISQQACDLLKSGKLVVFPTETVYGVACMASSDQGYNALRQLKQRPEGQPFTVHVADAQSAGRYADLSGSLTQRLVRRVFPGPVTIIAELADNLIDQKFAAMKLARDVRSRIYHENTVGLRCPDDTLAQKILGAINEPVIASSANTRGQEPPQNGEEAARAIGEQVDLIIDCGPTRFAKPSTIVRITAATNCNEHGISVERTGVYDERFIRKLLQQNILLVCSGNTCRSPMAEAIGRKLLSEKQQNIAGPDSSDATVWSAGVYAIHGAPASAESIEAMAKIGIDLTKHRSRPLTAEMIHEAETIYCMTTTHRAAVIAIAPTSASKTFTLDPDGDIDDPIGSGSSSYQRCADLIHQCLSQRFKEHLQ
ncbi:MAG: threonylcarbamoyl-AMP synthase [Phycisphaeraceae bacterium]|nr:threonylcarbamoyl-AMP synthase [Phycisphaeraceae bacterium]